MIHEYNSGMRGVDLLDKTLSSHRPQLANKKRWWNLFGNALNMAVIAGYLLYKAIRLDNSQIAQLEFQWEVTIAFLRIKPRKDCIRPVSKAHIPITLKMIDG